MSTYTYTPSLYQFPSLLKALAQTSGPSPSLDLRFALDKSLTAYRGPTPSFSRASTASYFDGSGVLRYAALNLNLYSEQFDNAAYTKNQGAVSANQTTAPDGKITADSFTASAGTVNPHAYQAVTTANGSVYTFSIYVKKNTHDFVQIVLNGVANGFANFDINNGVLGTLGAGGSAASSIVNVGNGWYRCVVSYTTASTSGNGFINLIGSATAGRGATFTAAGTESVYLWGQQLELSSTVGTYCPTTSSANSAPRFNHTYNGTSWVSKGLLVEEQRTNILQNSEQFNTSPWTALNASVVANSIASPDGNTTADKVVESATGPHGHEVYYLFSASATTYTTTVFSKAGERSSLYISLGSTINNGVYFSLSNGTVGTATGGLTGQIQDVGNGWYRCSVTGALSAGTNYIQIALSNGTTYDYIGNGTSGIYLFGAQLEVGSFATSYIPTTTASTTRSADVCQITGGDFSGFWNGTEGSIVAEWDARRNSTDQFTVYWAKDAGSSNTVLHTGRVALSPPGVRFTAVSGASVSAEIINAGFPDPGVQTKTAGCYRVNDFAYAYNGNLVGTDTSGAVPVNPTEILIGSDPYSNWLNGHIARLRYFNKRLPNATLQLLSEPDPTLNLQFALNKTLTPVAGPAPSFSRASTGSYFDSTGTLKYANVNLLTYSEQFDNAAWSERVGNTLYTNVAASPIGDMTADQLQLTSSGFYYQKKAYSTTGTHTFSVWLRSSSPTTTLLRLSNDAGTENSVATCNVTTSWQRFSVTRNWSANPVNFYAGLDQRTVVGGPGTSTDVFIWGAQLELASSPTQYAKTEASTTAGPRFDHVYSGGQWVSRGLLLEEQRTNISTYSEDFSNAAWTLSGATISANAIVAPDGNATADGLIENSSNIEHFLYQLPGPVVSSGSKYVMSVFAKKGSRDWAILGSGSSGPFGSGAIAYFNLANGTVGTLGAAVNSATIADVGNGWYRCCIFLTAIASTNSYQAVGAANVDGTLPYQGNGSTSVYIWGFQLEAGAFPTSYTGTTSSSVTRSADVCQITGTSFGSMWNQGEWSVVAEFSRPMAGSVTGDSMVYIAAGSGAPSSIQNGGYITSGNISAYGYESAFTYDFNHGTQLANTSYKIATGIKLNDFASSLNGAAVLTDNSGTVGANQRLMIGYLDWSGGNRLNGHIAKLIYYPARLTNAKLQQLST